MNKPSLNLEQSEKKKLNEKHSYYMAWSMRHHHFCIITHHSSNPNTFYIITYRQLNNLQRHSFVHSFKTHVKKKVFPLMMCVFVCETTNIPFLCCCFVSIRCLPKNCFSLFLWSEEFTSGSTWGQDLSYVNY